MLIKKYNLDDIETVEISKQFISQFLPKNPVIVEAGGHIGRDAIRMAKFWHEATIYSFEPVKELYDKLVLNTSIYNNIFCYNFALSNKVESLNMYVSSGRSTALSSLFEPLTDLANHPETKFQLQEVKSTVLELWAKENNITYVDFFWFDMQGAELTVLESSRNIIKTAKAIFIELNLIKRYKDIPLYNELLEWFEENNFSPVAKDKLKYNKVNILFVNNMFTL
ncbi:FkbM family methyltransferase [Candidatus Babela massiliensis]|uniref:Methyltransferase FkbM family n=1 Tax=Candidatus Babela massiliensis TaxID=673862 RepID=V6DHL9_9BACT|nr:FkbM family methyltransferase [Candidatus Babela massiliensis]CDK31045.1 methyltransferase FkbM family [Candidatus Babela massiliensis]